jgi:hypothetical protein
MPVKLLMTWDISPEHEQDYFDFVMGEFVPGVQRLGLQPVEAWATVYGNHPQILVAMLSESLSGARQAMQSDGWNQIADKLFALVRNFDYKIVPARGGFQF